MILNSFRRFFKHDFRVLTATTAVDAIRTMHETRVDVVLSDWNLERTTAEAVLFLCDAMGVPVVVLTADTGIVPAAKWYLYKPASMIEIQEAVHEALASVKSDSPL